MADDLRSTLERQLPVLFARGLAELEQHAPHDPSAVAALAALEPPAVSMVRWSGAESGELWSRSSRKGLELGVAADTASFGHGLGLSDSATRHLLGLLERQAS